MNIEKQVESVPYLIYLVSPNKTSFEKWRDVPNYTERASLLIRNLIILEISICWLTGRSKIRFNDTLANICQSVLLQIALSLIPTGQILVYEYIHEHYKLIYLPWNSPWTWFACLLLFDFMFYWGHRITHAINILWATHHTHHSSEYMNFGIGYRQNALQLLTNWLFFLPIAIFIPPSIFLTHAHLNALFQSWLHTELIETLEPLEYVFNTPSHHRVHHARNRKYVDKNFAGVLIIWDRMFGTFEPEKEKVVYGLTNPVNSHDLISIQFLPFAKMWNDFWKYKGIKNKLSVLFKGPGWAPGKPWCGNLEDIPDVKAPVPRYNVQLPMWCNIYLLCHIVILMSGHTVFLGSMNKLPTFIFSCIVFYEVLYLISIGFLLDKRRYAPQFEFFRCILHFALDFWLLQNSEVSVTTLQATLLPEIMIKAIYTLSVLLWSTSCVLESKIMNNNEISFVFRDKKLK